MLIQETTTTLPPAEVLRRAEVHFQAPSRHAAGLEVRGEGYVRFRADVGTVTVAALPTPGGGTLVRASAARQWGLVGSFLASLGQAHDVREELARYGHRRMHGALACGAAPARLEPAA